MTTRLDGAQQPYAVGAMLRDRRSNPRYPCLLVGEARPSGVAAFEVVCTSICRGGGFFTCRNAVHPGTPVTIVFRPSGSDGAIIECTAESMWHSARGGITPPGFGARWKSIHCNKGDDILRAFAAEHLRWVDLPALPLDVEGRALLRLTTDGRPSGVFSSQVQEAAPAVAVRPASVPVAAAPVPTLAASRTAATGPLVAASIREPEPTHFAATQPGSLATSQPGFIATTQPGSLATSQPGFIATTQPGFIATTQPGFIATTQSGSIATTQSGSIATTQPGFIAATQPSYSPVAPRAAPFAMGRGPLAAVVGRPDSAPVAAGDAGRLPQVTPAEYAGHFAGDVDGGPAVPTPQPKPNRKPSRLPASEATSPTVQPFESTPEVLIPVKTARQPDGPARAPIALGPAASAPIEFTEPEMEPFIARPSLKGPNAQSTRANARPEPSGRTSGHSSEFGQLPAPPPVALERSVSAPTALPTADNTVDAAAVLSSHLAAAFSNAEENGPTIMLDPRTISDLVAFAQRAALPAASGDTAAPRFTDSAAPRFTDSAAPRFTDSAAPRFTDSAAPQFDALEEELPASAFHSSHVTAPDHGQAGADFDQFQAASVAPITVVTAPELPDTYEDPLGDLLNALDRPSQPAAAPTGPDTLAAQDPHGQGFGSTWGPPTPRTLAALGNASGSGADSGALASRYDHDRYVAPSELDGPAVDPSFVANPTVSYGPAGSSTGEQLAVLTPERTVADGKPIGFGHAMALRPGAVATTATPFALPTVAPKETTVAYVREVRPTAPPPMPEIAELDALLMPVGGEATVTLKPGTVHPILDQLPPGVPRSISNRYEQLQRIGQGGHGVVFRAVDKMLDRFVVLKFLLQSSLSTEMARKYFMREVKLSASLNHPNIVHIYDIGNTDGVLWYAMEFVDGVTLSQYLPTGKPVDDMGFLYSAFSQLCEALDSAHGQGILHRDVKPDNALVAHDGCVKLFDFGLARIADQGFGEQSLLLGTPFYMAPEQLTGGKVDHRADVYALGILLYRMLAGELPFRDGNIFAAHVLEPVPDPRQFNPQLNESVVKLLLKMLAKQPEQRPSSCRPIAVDLWTAMFGGG
ncbi:MAG: hypothetical protein EXR77_08490 [Myxococcales bacterium]|nr:hypothetical protein [Myxococcales bacterium]